MKTKLLIPLSVLALATLTGCSIGKVATSSSIYVSSSETSYIEESSSSSLEESSKSESSQESSEEIFSSKDVVSEEVTSEEITSEDYGSEYQYNSEVTVESPSDIEETEISSEFELSSEDGDITFVDGIYHITTAGTYSISGNLEGQILVEAGDDDEVVLELNGASISYDKDSPIKAVSGGKLEISAQKNTSNSVKDNRNKKTVDSDDQGEGAISADIDLKLKGTGTLVVTGNFNNAVHTTKDLTIQKLSLKATGYNNALKGKDSVTITSGIVQAYAITGNGIKTEDSDISSKGKQRGTISITGGTVYVDSLHDALDASYNVEIDEADNEVPTNITVKTGSNSSNYSKSTFVADSEKGIKAANNILIKAGTVTVAASDDAIHANYGDTLENSSKGEGNIVVSGGSIQVASGDDGLHADNTLTISDGKVVITGAKEGLEGNYINITGGSTYVYGTDDGVNVSKKSFNNCAFTMSGGYLDVAISNGDTDGIDSNGNFTLSGGTIITRGSPGSGSNMSTGLDVDGTASITGGTLIAFNGLEKTPSKSSTVYYAATSNASSSWGAGGPGGGRPGGGPGGGSSSSGSISAGNFTLSGTNFDLSFTNDYNYSSFLIYSSELALNSSYTLSRNGSTLYSWTQSSSSVTIS